MLINELNNEKTFAINSKFVKNNINTTLINSFIINDKVGDILSNPVFTGGDVDKIKIKTKYSCKICKNG